MFPRLPNPVALEEEVLGFWDERKIFEKSLEQAKDRPTWVFYEGPPTANGLPHNGHVLTRVMKDVFPRFQTMRGFHVPRKAGWDTHGLPVEVEVEKSLGIHGREAILDYGLENFNRKCIDSVFVYVQEWEELTRNIGFWLDMDGYVTYHATYVQSVWWALSVLFEKGLLYKSHKVVWWWPQGGTALSAGEVGTGYREVDDPAITLRFRDADHPGVSFLAWTTTPWTLPSNVALAVGPTLDYAICDDPAGGEVILAAARAEAYGLVPKQIVKGATLVGRRYEPLYDFGKPEGKAFVVVAGAHVTLDAGAGVVHTAPAFGEDDMAVARAEGLAVLQWIAPDGKFTPNAGAFAGKFCKDADVDVIRDLKDRGLLFKRDTIRHPYPFCPRADQDPLIQYARPAWFIRTTDFVAEALANNAATAWHPEHIKEGRFGDFLRNNVDWALSRERFWGTPLNVWVCETCGAAEAPASIAAIEAKAPGSFDASVDEHLRVHRPWIDKVTWACEACGGTKRRVPEVIDCWFDSGCMPFAQWGWPHQNHEKFDAAFPADFISEAIDQTRGWFYSLLMISTMLFDDETCKKHGLAPRGLPRPFKNCLVLGHVCDMDGKKESKSKGNYTSPNLVLRGVTKLAAVADPGLARGTIGLKRDQVASLELGEDRVILTGSATEPVHAKVVPAKVGPKDTCHLHPEDLAALGLADGAQVSFRVPYEPPGADAFRWLFCASSPPWSNTRLSLRAIREGQRDFLIRLRNVYQFFAIYAEIGADNGSFDPKRTAPRAVGDRHLLDRWITGQLNATIATVTRELDAVRLYEASRALSAFVDDLSNWYVRRSRERFWGEGVDLEDSLWTLWEVLVGLSKVLAPFVPFTAEALYRALVVAPGVAGPESVHLCAWPEAGSHDPALAADMALIRDLASLGLSARAASKLKVRQPLHDATVILADPSRRTAVDALAGLLTDELNVHRIVFAEDAGTYVDFAAKPDFKKLGARLGKDMKAVAAKVAAIPGVAISRALAAGGLEVTLEDGRNFSISADEVLVTVTPKAGFQASSSAAAVVAVKTELDEALRAEGFVRELVNRVQTMRKEADLGYTQRIELDIDADRDVLGWVETHAAYLKHETLATAARLGQGRGNKAVDVEGRAVRVRMTPK